MVLGANLRGLFFGRVVEPEVNATAVGLPIFGGSDLALLGLCFFRGRLTFDEPHG